MNDKDEEQIKELHKKLIHVANYFDMTRSAPQYVIQPDTARILAGVIEERNQLREQLDDCDGHVNELQAALDER